MPGVGKRLKQVMRTPPMRFQIQGVRFIEGNHGRALLGDDMGLGKTYQSIGWMALHPEVRPCIVVCPSSGKYHWQREFETHAGLSSTILNGRKTWPLPYHEAMIWILNYDILTWWMDRLLKMKPKMLIIDECHYIKNRAVKRTAACVKLARSCKHVLALSGTPVINRPIEFFPTLNIIDRKEWSSFWRFAFRYCDPKRGFRGLGWDFTGASNTGELHEKVSRVMIRRMKEEVLPDLPPKTRTVIPVDITNMAEYRAAERDFLKWLREKRSPAEARRAAGAPALVKVGVLKRLAAEGKMKAILQWIGDWFEETEQKLVLFSWHRVIQGILRSKWPDAAVIDGSVSLKKRQEEVDRFQEDPSCMLLLGQLKAAGTVLTLTAASNTAFTEMGWTPADHDQAEDRVRRIGQTADHVGAYYFVGKGTVEEEILELLDAKRQVCSEILDGQDAQFSIMDVLLKSLKKRRP